MKGSTVIAFLLGVLAVLVYQRFAKPKTTAAAIAPTTPVNMIDDSTVAGYLAAHYGNAS
jgi:hypothetical protein